MFGPRDVAQGGVDVEVADHRVVDLSAGESARPAHEEHDAGAAVIERRLCAWEGEAVIRRADDQCSLGEAEVMQAVEHRAYSLVQRSRAGLEGGHVPAR